MQQVLFVCMGNICRSAMAEGILREKIRQQQLPLRVDSAGTHAYHNGDLYDPRARQELAKHHITVDDLRSRRIHRADFTQFDVIFAADRANIADLKAEFGTLADKVKLMTTYSDKTPNSDVPDPYYGGVEGFANVYGMLDESICAWLNKTS